MGKNATVTQAIDDNIVQRMRFACLITKPTDTHSEYVILIPPHDNGYANVPRCYTISALPVLFVPDSHGIHKYHMRQNVEFSNVTAHGTHIYHRVLNGETPRVFWTGNGDTANEFIRANHET